MAGNSNLKGSEVGRTHDLTIEEVKACEIFKNLTDEQALDVIETIKRFTEIIYNYHQNHIKKLD